MTKLRGWRFFLLIAVIYAALLAVDSGRTLAALEIAGAVLVRLLPIFAAVIVLTALLTRFLSPGRIARLLGRESGAKGWGIALLGGVVSHGPMYAWFPMFKELRERGVSPGLMAAFFYARAIKLPLLPLMIDYFGLLFTVVLSLYILAGAFVQGKAAEWLLGDGEGR